MASNGYYANRITLVAGCGLPFAAQDATSRDVRQAKQMVLMWLRTTLTWCKSKNSYVLARWSVTQKVKVFRAVTLLGVCHKWCDGRKGSTEACLKSTATNYVENFLRKIEWKVSL